MKRILSMALSLLMIISMIPFGTMTANAASLDSRVEAAIQWAISIANDDSHGYSQANRNGPDYDCSSFVSTAFKNGGFSVSGSLNTSSMANAFVNVGFTKYKKGDVTIQRGDILLKPGSHVELYLGDNTCVAAHSDYNGASGDGNGKEIQVRTKNYCTFCKQANYTYILRYNGSTTTSYTYSFNFNANGGTLGSTGAFTTTYGQDFQILNTTCTRSGYTWAGWNVKRNNDNKWYVAGQGWCTDSQISSNGYTKKVYSNYQTCTLDDSWINGISGNGSYTFYAVWIQSRVDTLKVFLSPYGEGCDHVTALNNYTSSGYAQDQIYAWYILYDGNTGDLMNTYSNKTYSVELAVHDPNGDLVYNYTYTDSSDANWIGVTPQMSGTYTATATISGAYSGSISTTYEVSYDAELLSSVDSVSLNLNDTNSRNIVFTPTENYPGLKGYNATLDSSIASITEHYWSGGQFYFTIQGNKVGSTTLYVKLYENYTGNKNVVATISIPVTVTANTYTITYNANGGSGAPSSQTKYYGTDITLSSTVPTRSGYTFLGWATSSTATSATYQPGATYSSNSALTLYAVWKADATALGENSTSIARISPAGTTVYYTFTPSVNGKYVIYSVGDLDGRVYLYNSSGTLLDNDDDGGEERNFRLEYYMVAGTTYRFGINLYDSSLALPIVFRFGRVYTVSYNANGGSGAPSAQSKDYDKAISLSSTIPTRSGYTFMGWSTSSTATSATYQSGDEFAIDANTTLYAVWKVTPTAMNVNSSNTAVISTGGEMKYFTYTPTTSGTYVIYSTGSDDTKVHLYNASGTELDNDDDSGDSTNFRLEYDLTADTTYTLGVRYYNSSKTGTISFKFGNVYTITYNANGGSGSPSSQNKDYGTDITLSSTIPTKTGYTFLGWSTSSTATSATYQAGSSFSTNANTTLYAVWKTNTYTISYNANGGSGAPSSQTKNHGASLTLSSTVPTRTGYTFLGWATSSTATSATYQPGNSFTSNANVTLYAVWKADTYTISYNANGGSGAPSSQTKTYGVSLTLSSTVPTRTGYTFLGWATSSTATSATYQPGGSFTSNANTTLYAVWKGTGYTVSYNANGGSGAPSNQAKTHGTSLTLSSTKPTRTGYTFLGWATSSTATSATYQPGGSFTTNANTTLYAVWKANTYTISYNANGGSGTMSNSSHTYDVSKALTSNVYTRSGYTFLGWATSSSATAAAYTNGQSVKNLTATNNATVVLYAVWKQGCDNGTHTYNYTATKAPTTSATGTLTGTCSKCSGTTTVTLPKLSTTDYSYSVRTAATCTVAGSGRYTWKTTTYGSFFFDVSISATGHNYSNGSCTRCGAKDPVSSYVAYVYTEAKKSVVQGSQFTYTVSLAGTYDGFSFEIASGNGLTVTDIITTNSNINIDKIGDKWMVSVLGGLAKTDAEKEELVTVTVQVASNAELGARTLTLSNLMLSSESGDKVSAIKYEYASIEITDQIPGDINGDGTFDYYDVSKLYAYYRNKTTLSESVDTDVNGDGGFDYYDVSKLYAIYRGKANFN